MNLVKKYSAQIIFFISFWILLLSIPYRSKIPSGFADEYWNALQVALLENGNRFHSHHILSWWHNYFWGALSQLLGFEVSAFRACQLASIFWTAVGATAIFDLGLFFGLAPVPALLASAILFLSNSFVRYGVSAYPVPVGLGIGLVGVNLLLKNAYRNSSSQWGPGSIFGWAALSHMAIVPLLVIGATVPFFHSARDRFRQAIKTFFLPLSLLVGGVYFLWFIYSLIFPDKLMKFNIFLGLGGKGQAAALEWGVSPSDFKNATLAMMALIYPGVHWTGYSDLLLNLPRIFATLVWGLLLGFFFLNRTQASSQRISSAKALALGTLPFVLVVIFKFSTHRQYMHMSWIGLAPLAMLLLAHWIQSTKNSWITYSALFCLLLGTVWHMVFGVEGLTEIVSPPSENWALPAHSAPDSIDPQAQALLPMKFF